MDMHIGSNIKRLRLEHGMTQEQLAARLNVSTAADGRRGIPART